MLFWTVTLFFIYEIILYTETKIILIGFLLVVLMIYKLSSTMLAKDLNQNKLIILKELLYGENKKTFLIKFVKEIIKDVKNFNNVKKVKEDLNPIKKKIFYFFYNKNINLNFIN